MHLTASQLNAIKPVAGHYSNAISRARGFTMVELITVMVILGVIAAVAIPRFFDRATFDSRGFYDQVIATLRHAQKVAIAQHQFVCVAFTANSVTLTIGPGSTCGMPLTSPSGDTPYVLSSSNATFNPTPAGFSFNALGQPSFSGAARVVTVSGYDATPIIIEAETGYVH